MADFSTSQPLIKVEDVSKKFCRSLKRSLWYGVRDVLGSVNPFARDLDRWGDDISLPNSTRMSGSRGPMHRTSSDIELRLDEFWALRDISFELKRGDCLGLVGHNGAGKSTLLKILNGLIRPDTGRITLRGRVAALVDLDAGFNPILSGRENIFTRAALLGFSADEVARHFDTIVDFADIGDFLDMPVQNYSSGMRVRLGFAVSAHLETDILIVDEVLAVGDAAFRHKCLYRMAELRKSTAMIFVSHNMPQVYRISSHVLVLNHGSIVYSGDQIGDGIQTYYQLQDTHQEQVLGGDLIAIQDVRFESNGAVSDEDLRISVEYGSPLRLRFRLRVKSGISAVGLKLSFWNQEMLPVMDVVAGTMRNYELDLKSHNEANVDVLIDRVPFSTGQHSISIVVTDVSYLTIYGRIDNVGNISIKAPYPTGAHQIGVATWNHSLI